MGYYCGWDGGGSKTEVCIMNRQGEVIAKSVFGPLNLDGSSEEIILGSVQCCIEFMSMQEGGLEACRELVIGSAGVSNQNVARHVESAVRQCGYRGKLKLMGDHQIALEGALDGPGCVLIAGTGSVCYGRDADGNTFQCGGCGYLIDDKGSGYAIGIDILTAVIHAQDGRGPSTCLTEEVFSYLHIREINELITWLYGAETGKKEIAMLAPILNIGLEKGDEAAKDIASRAARELAFLVISAWEKAGITKGEIALMGSIFKYCSNIREQASAIILQAFPQAHIIRPRRGAAQGAAELARKDGESDLT